MARMELRIAPPLLMLIAAAAESVLAWLDPTPRIGATPRVLIAGVLIALALALFRQALATLHRAHTTANPYAPQRSSALVTTGIFARSRNPMYLAMVLLLIGIAGALASPLALVAVILFVLAIDRWQIRPEERALQAMFPEAFLAYCQHTRRWI